MCVGVSVHGEVLSTADLDVIQSALAVVTAVVLCHLRVCGSVTEGE